MKFQFSLKSLLAVITLLSVVMALAYYAVQVPSVVLKGKSGAVCRIYPEWWYDNGATVYCDLAVNGKEVVHGEAISNYNADHFPTARYFLAEIDGGKTVVIFHVERMSEDSEVLFAYTQGIGIIDLSMEQKEEMKKHHSRQHD